MFAVRSPALLLQILRFAPLDDNAEKAQNDREAAFRKTDKRWTGKAVNRKWTRDGRGSAGDERAEMPQNNPYGYRDVQ